MVLTVCGGFETSAGGFGPEMQSGTFGPRKRLGLRGFGCFDVFYTQWCFDDPMVI